MFTQMLNTKDPLYREQYNIYIDAWKQKTFVSRTIQYLHKCLKTKDPLCWEQYNIYIDAWKQKTLCVENNRDENCSRTLDFPLLSISFYLEYIWQTGRQLKSEWNNLKRTQDYIFGKIWAKIKMNYLFFWND